MDAAGCDNLARANAPERGSDAASSGSAVKKAAAIIPFVMGGAPVAPAALMDGVVSVHALPHKRVSAQIVHPHAAQGDGALGGYPFGSGP